MIDPTPLTLTTRAVAPALAFVPDEKRRLREVIAEEEGRQDQRRAHIAELCNLVGRREEFINTHRTRLAYLEENP